MSDTKNPFLHGALRSDNIALWRMESERLRILRAVLNLSEKQIAKALGVSLRTYRGYEGGKQMTTNRLLSLCSKFKVSTDWLLCGDGRNLKPHLTRKAAKVAILPIVQPSTRRRLERISKEGLPSGTA
jgi:transcriptional regulator with XRE-family HTH domain